jgi:GTPase SAR1 family protein
MLGNLDDSSVTAPLLRDITSVDFDFILKILIVGDSISGKSQLFHRFAAIFLSVCLCLSLWLSDFYLSFSVSLCLSLSLSLSVSLSIYLSVYLYRFADETFNQNHEATKSVEYRHRYIETNKNRCKVQVWDCVASASKAIMTSIYRGANAIILLIDVTNPSSLEAIPDWLREIREFSPPSAVIYLVGTKIDSEERVISSESCQEISKKFLLRYSEVSSKTGAGVDLLFASIVEELEDRTVDERDAKEERMSLSELERKKSKREGHDPLIDGEEDGRPCCPCCSIM